MTDYAALVAALAVPYRAPAAYHQLFEVGWDALPAVREGLRSKSGLVRMYCCRFLDHYLTEEGLEDLLGLLGDEQAAVRITILHTLACERCKEGSCRPQKARVLPLAIDRLRHDPNPHVRAMAVEVVGSWVHAEESAVTALQEAHLSDPSSAVRKKAGWYAPGGTIYRKSKPRLKA